MKLAIWGCGLLLVFGIAFYMLITNARGKEPEWHKFDKSADMRLLIRPWCVPGTRQWPTCVPKVKK